MFEEISHPKPRHVHQQHRLTSARWSKTEEQHQHNSNLHRFGVDDVLLLNESTTNDHNRSRQNSCTNLNGRKLAVRTNSAFTWNPFKSNKNQDKKEAKPNRRLHLDSQNQPLLLLNDAQNEDL